MGRQSFSRFDKAFCDQMFMQSYITAHNLARYNFNLHTKSDIHQLNLTVLFIQYINLKKSDIFPLRDEDGNLLPGMPSGCGTYHIDMN